MAGLLFCVLLGAFVRFGLFWGLDLRGAFGPDAPGAAAAAVLGPLSHPYPLHPLAIALIRPLTGGDPVQAAKVLSLLSGLAMVVAVWSMGRSLAGEQAGRAAGAVAATAPLLVYPALLGGGDALALAIACSGAALAWRGALHRKLLEPFSTASNRELFIIPIRRYGIQILSGCVILGLSAAAKPVAIPMVFLLLLVPFIGGRRTLPWLAAGLVLGGALSSPYLGPLVHPVASRGLLGSWWYPSPPQDLLEWAMLPWKGASALMDIQAGEPWAMGIPIALLAFFGAIMPGSGRRERLMLFLLGFLAMLSVGAMLGERLRPRYLCSALLGWAILAGIASVPPRVMVGAAAGHVIRRRPFLEALPLSLLMSMLVVSTFRYWEAMAQLRTQEEGTAQARSFLEGWNDDFRPVQDYTDNSICGALELERWAAELEEQLPRDAVLAAVPLRDARIWHLRGPLQAARPDVNVVELSRDCCPGDPATCAQLLPQALSGSGGLVISPLLPQGRCETGAVDHQYLPLVDALEPMLRDRKTWYGAMTVHQAGTPGLPLCQALGGQVPQAPARLD